MKILMTGATGWVGRHLGLHLVKQGHELVALVRDPKAAALNCAFPARWIEWKDAQTPIPEAAFDGVEAVIHLMGEPVAGARWTEAVKKRILDSRVDSTKAIARQVIARKIPHFVSASAIGYYGDRGEEELTEASGPGRGFLAEVCRRWEEELFKAQKVSRTVAVRIGVVLGRDGGALEKMVPPFLAGAGGPMGSGKQWMSWIHLNDLVRLLAEAVQNAEYRGPVNATAPHPVRQKDLARSLGQVLHRPAFLPAPKFALYLALGEMAGFLLSSAKIRPDAATERGFRFEFPELKPALEEILAPESRGERLLTAHQYVDRPLEEVFPFYASEANLEKITPPFLNFKVLGKNTPSIQSGTLIDYRLKLHGIPLKWRTKIEDWQPPRRFTDTQLNGPYALWHHTHLFEKLGTGTLITDLVRYRVPLGNLGALVAGPKVNSDVQTIFKYRRGVISEEFK